MIAKNTEPVPRLLWMLLLAVSALGVIGGVVMALLSPAFDLALTVVYRLAFGSSAAADLTQANRVLINTLLAISGGLQAGASAMIGFMAYFPIRRGERWALMACVTGLIFWFVLDTGLTVWYYTNGYHILWPKIVIDLGFLGMFGVPYIALYRYCKN
jgi:hypothetical protein